MAVVGNASFPVRFPRHQLCVECFLQKRRDECNERHRAAITRLHELLLSTTSEYTIQNASQISLDIGSLLHSSLLHCRYFISHSHSLANVQLAASCFFGQATSNKQQATSNKQQAISSCEKYLWSAWHIVSNVMWWLWGCINWGPSFLPRCCK